MFPQWSNSKGRVFWEFLQVEVEIFISRTRNTAQAELLVDEPEPNPEDAEIEKKIRDKFRMPQVSHLDFPVSHLTLQY